MLHVNDLNYELDSFLYVFSSAGNCAADVGNRKELEKWKIIPRMLRDATNRSIKVCIHKFAVSHMV